MVKGEREGEGVDLVKFGGLTMVTTVANNDATAWRGRGGGMMAAWRGGGIRDGRKALQRRKEGRNAECRRLDLNRANFSSLSLGKEDLCIICCLHARALTHTTSDTVGFDRIPTSGLMRVICIALLRSWTSALPGHIGYWHFWQVCPHKEYQKMVLISFEHLQKISNFPKLQGCGAKNEPATPISNLK